MIQFLRRVGTILINILLHPIMTFVHLVQQFPLMWKYIKDPQVPLLGKITFIAASIGYVLSPLDLIPEGGAALAGFIPPVMIVLFLLGILEDFLLGIPLIGKLFIWWAKKYSPPEEP